MKISQQPTDHILVKASCQSEWDNCDFAIVTLGEPWKMTMKKRFEAAESFLTDYDFRHFTYHDDNVSFYVSKEDEAEALFAEAAGKEWIYVTLDEDEEESFVIPENRLEAHSMALYKCGAGMYKAYGKYSGEGFYTAILPFKEILDNMLPHKMKRMDKVDYAELLNRENQLRTDMKCLIDKVLDHHDGKVEYPDMCEIDDDWDYPVSMTMEGRKYDVTGSVVAVSKDGDCFYVDIIDRDNGRTEVGFIADERHYSDILYFLREAHDAMEKLINHREKQS